MIAVTTVLVTGANKVSRPNRITPAYAYHLIQGLGRGFVQKYLSRPDTVVVAAVRNPESEESKALLNLNKAQGSKLILVKIESASAIDALGAVESIKKSRSKACRTSTLSSPMPASSSPRHSSRFPR